MPRDIAGIRDFRLAVVAGCLVGLIVRAAYTLRATFPMNDGGLFYAMSDEIRQAGYALPSSVPYNGADIPLAYPPLGLYVAAFIADATPLSLADVYLYLPLVISCLTVPAFYVLARELLGERVAAAVATVIFALIPRSFIWLLMGGGVTRSFGMLFALLASLQIVRMSRAGQPRHIVLAAVFTSLTFLSHLETGWFLAISASVVLLTSGRLRDATPRFVVLAIAAAMLAAPWWGAVVIRHGIDPFAAAAATGGSIVTRPEDALLGLGRMTATSEPFFPVLGMLGVLGAIYSLVRREWFLPLWWAAIILLDLRAFPTFTTIPIALCAGIALTRLLVPALTAQFSEASTPSRSPGRAWRLPPAPVTVAVATLFAFALVGAVISRGGLNGESNQLRSLSNDERSALAWVARETPSGSRFLVVPSGSWEAQKTAEWFPVLARRVSITTVQGTEWLPDDAFQRRVDVHDAAFLCGYTTADCLDRLTSEFRAPFDYVFLPGSPQAQCCEELKRSLLADPRYQIAYDGPGATIFIRSGS